MPKANRFGFPGVTWDRRHDKWMVQIRLGHRNVRLGYLDDFDDARRVYLGAKVLLQVFKQPPTVRAVAGGPSPLTGSRLPVRLGLFNHKIPAITPRLSGELATAPAPQEGPSGPDLRRRL